MSDEGDRTCPLCAEEMDMTDRQLKPCKCGYEICVWCWHHIMDMAEKDDTEGRCPACRAPYDKEKIVGTAANCERLVAEVSSERKVKPQKTKFKTSEGRKQLSNVRVIQRNLVYIVGLPLNLADEDILQRREYFGQYGKVLKVSMSRTAAGVIQQFPNSTCSVYITYGKEEEAVRCIQLVNGFVLDGRSLRACFGTTKYCHAWLRNVACTNPDCLYLHEVGSQEDSFTKDEIISACTRVQQITCATNNLQRRSGSVLPPLAEDYCNSSSASTGKPIIKNSPNTTTLTARGSPPNGSSSRSVPLPAAAAWGTRASNCQQASASSTCSNGPAKSKSDATAATLALPSAVASTSQASLLSTSTGKKPTLHEDSHSALGKVKAEPLKSTKRVVLDYQTATTEKSATPDGVVSSLSSNDRPSSLLPSKDNDKSTIKPSNIMSSDYSKQPAILDAEKSGKTALNGKIQNLCPDVSSMSIERNVSEHSGVSSPSSSTDHGLTKLPSQASQQHYTENYREPLTSNSASKPAPAKSDTYDGVCGSTDQSDRKSNLNSQPSNSRIGVEEDVLSFDCQRLKDPEVMNYPMPLSYSTDLIHGLNLSRAHSLQQIEADAVNLNADPLFVDNNAIDRPHLHASNVSTTSNGPPGYRENSAAAAALSGTLEHSFVTPNNGKGIQMERLLGNGPNGNGISADKGESSIISNILSMDFDVWDDSLTSPKNLAKFLGGTDEQSGPGKIPSPWKAQNNTQSRFSFARQEEPRNQPFDFDTSFSGIGQLNRNRSFSQDFAGNGDSFFGKSGMGNGFSYSKLEELDNFGSNHSAFGSNKLSAVSRGQISAPPGFSAPSRAPPPGFSSQERMDQAFDPMSGNHFLDTSSLFRNSYQAPPTGNVGNAGDIEFMDPAILAVGKERPQGGLGLNNAGLDMRSDFTQLSAFENDARLQLLMQQRSVSQQPSLRYPDIGDNYAPRNESYGISSRLMDQPHVNSLSSYQQQLSLQQQSRSTAMPNGHWDGWNEFQNGNSLGMAELLRNERLGFNNKFYTGYEDSKFRMPSSAGDMYNRTFGM